MRALAEIIQPYFSFLEVETIERLLASTLIILLILVIRWVVLRIALRQVKELRSRYRWRKTSSYTASIIGIFLVGSMWISGLNTLSTFLGLVSAGIAIALRDPLVGLAGWGFMLWRRPFQVGDRINIGKHTGDVIDIRLFQFTMLEIGNWVHADQSTGRIIHIPNGVVFTEPITSYTTGFHHIWIELPVLVTYESDWQKAKKILEDIANQYGLEITETAEKKLRKASERFMIYYNKLTPIVYTSVESDGVLLTIRCLAEPRKRRSVEQFIWEEVLKRFAENDDIDFAYRTQRIYNNRLEGKPGAGGSEVS